MSKRRKPDFSMPSAEGEMGYPQDMKPESKQPFSPPSTRRGMRMGHHIDDRGRFQSDRHPDLPPDKIILSFREWQARFALRIFCELTDDAELAADIRERINILDDEETTDD